MQEKERFEHYTPQYPLPVDISSMSRQDTICQFCGVSYLIHNEIKALEAKCQKLESDLVYYAGMSSREATLEKSLENERTRIIDLESIVSINTHKINELTRKVQLAQDQLHHSQLAHQHTKSSFSQYVSSLRGVSQQLEPIRREHSILKEFYSKEIHNFKTSFQSMQKEIQTTISQYTEQQLNINNQTLHDVQVKYQESQRKTHADVESAREEIRIHEKELSRLREHLAEIDHSRRKLQNEFEQSQEQCRQLTRDISEKDQSNKHLGLQIGQHREQLINERDLRLKTESESEQLRVQLSQLTAEKKEFESNEVNSRRKLDEINRSRQAVLDRTRDEYEKLLGKYNDLDEVYRELVVIREKDTVESTTIRRELERLHDENIELNKQKQTLHIAHDVQMKKLHDSYAVQLREMEQWPVRLQELREQHRLQMSELERRLRDTFATELDIEKQKTSGLLRKYEHDSDHSRQQLRHELVSTEKVTIEQRQFYEQQIEQLQGEKRSLQTELDTLRGVLKELHEQMSSSQMTNDERMHIMTLKEDLVAKETSLFQSQTIINDLNKELQQTREEMITLQETVHKECSEREQLKDALIDARQQLLTLKKNGVLNGTVSRSLHSPPVAFEDIERRVSGPLPFPHASSQQYSSMAPNPNPSFVRSEPSTREGSLPGDTADSMARPMSSSHHASYRNKTLPPIYPQQQQQRRRNGSVSSTNKNEQALENQRRIARFIKHIK